jgi:hypothetical protein
MYLGDDKAYPQRQAESCMFIEEGLSFHITGTKSVSLDEANWKPNSRTYKTISKIRTMEVRGQGRKSMPNAT